MRFDENLSDQPSSGESGSMEDETVCRCMKKAGKGDRECITPYYALTDHLADPKATWKKESQLLPFSKLSPLVKVAEES